jgi:hypothetical protein
VKTITCKVVIPSDRQLRLVVPEDIPPGPADVVLVIASDNHPEKGLTAGDLLRSLLCGIWKNRTDMGDSLAYAHKLWMEAERRSRE